MIVLFPFNREQFPALLELLEWIVDLDGDRGNVKHNALLVAAKGVDKGQLMAAVELCERTFGSVTAINQEIDKVPLMDVAKQYVRDYACESGVWLETAQAPAEPGWADKIAAKCTVDGEINEHYDQFALSAAIPALRKKFGKEKPKPKCYIQLGRYGDLMIALRALKVLADETGEKQKLIVSHHYAPMLDGTSYIEPHVITGDWWGSMPVARNYANSVFGGYRVLQCHGRDWGVSTARWPNYQTSMWDRTGVPLEVCRKAPLIFDRRNRDREAALLRRHANGKPMVLFNFAGVSSPFPYTRLVMQQIQRFRDKFTLVDLSQIRAERIYDLLGLYDEAALLISTDTSTMHLASASSVRHIAFLVGGWNCSIPGGNCVLSMMYEEVPARVQEVGRKLEEITT